MLLRFSSDDQTQTTERRDDDLSEEITFLEKTGQDGRPVARPSALKVFSL
jgi:hypothetical protein